jgi:hypothetical protein
MKNALFLFAACASLLACKTTYYPNFPELGPYYLVSKESQRLAMIHQFAQGVYHFDVCMKDSTIEDQNIMWFCDCSEPEKEVKETISLLFVDDARVLYFKNFNKSNTKLDLDKLDRKYLKIGIYKIMPSTEDSTMSDLTMSLHYPSSKDSTDRPIRLLFQVKDTVLSLKKMEYVRQSNGVLADTDGGMGISTRETKYVSIDPPKEFSYQTMDFVFAPTPFQLSEDKTELSSIEYVDDGQGGLKRVLRFTDKNLGNKSKPIYTIPNSNMRTW